MEASHPESETTTGWTRPGTPVNVVVLPRLARADRPAACPDPPSDTDAGEDAAVSVRTRRGTKRRVVKWRAPKRRVPDSCAAVEDTSQDSCDVWTGTSH